MFDGWCTTSGGDLASRSRHSSYFSFSNDVSRCCCFLLLSRDVASAYDGEEGWQGGERGPVIRLWIGGWKIPRIGHPNPLKLHPFV